ncbi:MAG: glycosyltransferase [Euryarchaeota archaeon]|nr:glycosyltransferase [Euryarchaeota archaeon]
MLTTSYPLHRGEGRGAFVHELARRVAARGHRVRVVAVRFGPDSLPREEMDGVEVVRIPLAPGGLFTFDELTLRDPRTLQVLLSYFWGNLRETLAPRRRWDVIHAQWDIPCATAARPLGRLLGVPVVATVRGISANWPRTHPGVALATRWSLRGARRILAISPVLLHELEALGFRAPRLGLVRRGVDSGFFSPGPPTPGFAESHGLGGGRVVLFVGDLTARKGVPDLMEAFGRLSPRMADLRLAIVGDGPLLGPLRRQAERLGVSGRVHFAGRVSPATLVDYYRLSSVFALPSLAEAMGTSAIEAMACGRPTVVTSVMGEVEELKKARAAEVCKPEWPTSLAAAIERALGDAEGLGRRGREYALRSHSWEGEVETVLRAYREVLQETSSAKSVGL